jgi:PAS domain S-box-containing protein
LFDEHGVVTGLVGIGHDITTRKKAEEELRKLSQAVEQSPVSIIITDVDGVIEYVNPTFSELTGYTRQEAIGENPRILKSETTPKEMYTQLWNTIKSGREWHGEFQNKKKNGEIYFESALISPIFDQKGSITHFLASKEDITNRKIAEEVIRQKVEELAISNEELTRFNRLAIGREMRMIDIKKYCNHLAAQLGIEQPYRLAFLEENNNIVVDGNVVSSENNDKMK